MVSKTIDKLMEKLTIYEPEKVIVFGSAINGKWREDSDIDLAIIKKTDLPFYKRAAEVRKLLRSRTPVDIFVFTPDEYDKAKYSNMLVSEIDRTGKLIYGTN